MLLKGESLALTSSVYLSDDNWSSYQLCSTTQHVVYAFGSNYAFKKYKRNKACRYQATLCIMYCAVICFESHLFPKGYFLSVGVPYPEVMLPFIRDLYRKKPTSLYTNKSTQLLEGLSNKTLVLTFIINT